MKLLQSNAEKTDRLAISVEAIAENMHDCPCVPTAIKPAKK